MKIFLAGTSFIPSYGGPAVTVARLAQELSACGLDIGVWAPDGSSTRLETSAAEHGFRLLSGDLGTAWQAFGGADLIHDNGLWWAHNHAIASLARRHNLPRIVSTRGMLQPWCFRHKRFKKVVAWHLYQKRDLQRATALHVTSQEETDAARSLGLRTPAVLIPNGVDLPPLDATQIPSGELSSGSAAGGTALFLGRLYPVKGVDLLLQAWDQLRPAGWHLRVAGPDEAGTLAAMESLAQKLGLQQDVSFVGPVVGERKRQELQQADLLILPSRSESFGVVVAEGLAHQTPVLTTTATPWTQLERIGAGWLCEPEVESLAAAISRALNTSPQERFEMGTRGRTYVESELSWHNCADQFLNIYIQICSELK